MLLVPRPPIFLAGFIFVCHAETDTPESVHTATYTVGQESMDVPTKVSPGLVIDLTATIENTGDTEWSTKATYLRYIGEKDAGGVDLHLSAATAPGESGTLSGTMTAPTDSGDYTLVWQPIVEGYEIGTVITRAFTVSDEGGDSGP